MPKPDPAAVRRWAREQGLVAAERGRLPRAVVDAYAAAHPDAPARRHRPDRQGPPADAPAPRNAPTSAAGPAVLDGSAGNAPADERLAAVEAQLAQALARLDALERRSTRSVLGLRLSL